MKLVLLIPLSLLVLVSCTEPNEENDLGRLKPNKLVYTYSLAKIAKDATHKIASNHLRAVVSSGNGEFVYLLSDEKAGIKVLEVEKGQWHDALDWKKVPGVQDRVAVDLSNRMIGGFDANETGLLFSVGNNGGLVVLKGFGSENASLYPQNSGNFKNGAFTPYMVTKKDKSQFLYLFASGRVAKKGVLFRTYVEPPKRVDPTAPAWDKSLKKIVRGAELDTELYARTQDHEKNLLLADKDGIKRVLETDIGLTDKALANNGNPVFKTDSFKLDGQTKNDHINTMRLVDDKFLVVGLRSSAANDGGVAVLDLTNKSATWKLFGKGLGITIDDIAVERIAKREKTRLAAIITSPDKGFLLMDQEGSMMEVVKGKGHLVTAKYIDEHRAETEHYATASDGFVGDRVPLSVKNYRGAAQDKDGVWYIALGGSSADDGGVYKFEIKTEQVSSPAVEMTLP